MNKVKITQLLLAGIATFFIWVVTEILVEQVLGNMIFGNHIQVSWYYSTNIPHWSISNNIINILIALINCTVLIWLYASLRPMFGVGTKTALITSAFGIIFGLSMSINGINLGLFPLQIGLLESAYEAIEFPVAMIAGAFIYESGHNEMAV